MSDDTMADRLILKTWRVLGEGVADAVPGKTPDLYFGEYADRKKLFVTLRDAGGLSHTMDLTYAGATALVQALTEAIERRTLAAVEALK